MADALLQAMQAGSSPAQGLSYNVILTRQHLHFIPRAKESSGPVACNSLVSNCHSTGLWIRGFVAHVEDLLPSGICRLAQY